MLSDEAISAVFGIFTPEWGGHGRPPLFFCPMIRYILAFLLLVQVVPSAAQSRLSQWPVQIKLVPVRAPFFNGAKLLIAADCTAYAYAAFHERFIKGHITLVGCPKLDSVDYSEKLTEIIRSNDIKSVTVIRMEVPCCGGLEHAAKTALQQSGKFIPWQVVTISTDGRILD